VNPRESATGSVEKPTIERLGSEQVGEVPIDVERDWRGTWA